MQEAEASERGGDVLWLFNFVICIEVILILNIFTTYIQYIDIIFDIYIISMQICGRPSWVISRITDKSHLIILEYHFMPGKEDQSDVGGVIFSEKHY